MSGPFYYSYSNKKNKKKQKIFQRTLQKEQKIHVFLFKKIANEKTTQKKT